MSELRIECALWDRDEDASTLVIYLEVLSPTQRYEVAVTCAYIETLTEDEVRVLDVRTDAPRGRLHRVIVTQVHAWVAAHQDECCAAAVGAVRAAGEVWEPRRAA